MEKEPAMRSILFPTFCFLLVLGSRSALVTGSRKRLRLETPRINLTEAAISSKKWPSVRNVIRREMRIISSIVRAGLRVRPFGSNPCTTSQIGLNLRRRSRDCQASAMNRWTASWKWASRPMDERFSRPCISTTSITPTPKQSSLTCAPCVLPVSWRREEGTRQTPRRCVILPPPALVPAVSLRSARAAKLLNKISGGAQWRFIANL